MSKEQRLILITAILASLIAFLDSAIVNVALPAIKAELGGGLAIQQWVVDGYLITLGSLILIAGSISDLFGRKKILMWGLIGFGISSILCAIAPSSLFLIVARALQGIAGALLVPSSLALIMSSFSGREQGKAIGTWTAWTGVSFILGPVLGGFLVDAISWRAIFAINIIPIGITLWLLSLISKRDEMREGARIDYLGALMCALGLGVSVFALIEEINYSWSNPIIYLPLILGILLLITFIFYEKYAKHPMLPLGLFKHHNFSVGNIATFGIYAGLSGMAFVLVLFAQQVGYYSAFLSGFTIVPIPLILLLLSSKTGSLSHEYGPRWFMAGGPIIMGLGLITIILSVNTNLNYFTELLPGLLIFGLGLAITVAPLTAAILGDIEKESSGIGSAINNAVSRIAGLLAVAMIGLVMSAAFTSTLQNRLADQNIRVAPDVVRDAASRPFDVQPSESAPSSEKFQKVLSEASVKSFQSALLALTILIILGGVISGIWIRNQPDKSFIT